MNMRIYIYLAVVLTLPVYVHAQTISMDKTPYPEQYMGGTIGLVGTIGGEFQVSPSGAAQYDVTFDLPEGAGGFSPEIGIAYDSRRGDGVLGHGFYLKGLSMITRTGSDLYHDGSVSGVSMTDADHFALDGMRLLYKGDNLYVPELNNLWRIKTDKSGNPNYFTIENGEGSTMYYGSTMDGRISGSGEGSYLSWLLNKVEDANGNYYTIEYKNALGEFYVDNIKYGGNVAAGVSPAYTLKFTYSPREKCAVFYVLGNHYHTSHLLTSVEVFFGENFLRSYDFTYKTNVGKTLPYLKSIKLRGTDNIGFKSTSFEWSETPDATLLPGIEQPVFTGDNIGLYIGDFDGDGLRDYLEVANNANNKTQKIWRLFKNKGNGKFEYTNWGFLNNEHTRLLIGDFNADGNCTSVAGPRTSVTMEYDDAGRRTRMTDSDCGTYRFEYNGFGEQTFQLHETSYMGVITEYDAVGRVVRREDSDGITDYIYETGRRRAVKEIRNDDTGIVKRFNYDSYNRLTDETLTIDGATLHTGYSYDSKNRLTYITYPNNFGISYTYDDGGNLTCATQKGNAEAWKLLSVDETGRPLSYRLGNGIIVKRTLDPVTGVLTSMSDSTLFHWEYHFNAEGNLSSRTDGRNGLLELFAYDGLNRLTSFHHLMNLKPLSNETIEDIYTRFTYDAAGNITSHSKIGKYGYADNSNRLSTVRMPNIFVKPMLQKWDVIEYNSHRKVTRVVSGERELRLRYGVDGERVQAHEKGEDCDRSIIYVNKFHQIARNGNETCRHSYIYAGNMLIAVCPDADTSRTCFYHKNHLGSVVGISDAGGTLLEEFSYDPWGRRRSPASYKYIDEIDRPADRHGFTGHEHIDLLSMVNMNGRLYDPYLGRFLSPDPFVQAPYNTQSLNRYAYCINNPLKYTDDTGHFFIIDDWIIGAIKGIFSGDNIIKSANRHAVNAAKIIAGLFVTDPNKGFFGRALELFSRFTFQATQTMVGYMYSNIANMAGRVYNVSHAYGATAVANSWNSKSAVTLGSFILGREDLRADAGHPTFQHEYGHYLQSQRLGPAYWPAVALPSVFNVMYGNNHDYRSYEMNANYLAFRYFNEQIDGFYKTNHEYSTDHLKPDYYGWHFDKNPLLPGGKYVDYEIDEQKERMREATSIKVNFWNYFLPFIPNIR